MLLSDIRKGLVGQIPDYLKDGHYSGAKDLGRAIGYKYPHNYENGHVVQQYLPDKLKIEFTMNLKQRLRVSNNLKMFMKIY